MGSGAYAVMGTYLGRYDIHVYVHMYVCLNNACMTAYINSVPT